MQEWVERTHTLSLLTFVSQMKLIDWNYMDTSCTVRVDTTLHTIKETIKKYHGGKIKRLTVCLHSYQESNELNDDSLTLKQCGIDGAVGKENAPSVTLIYDFVPCGSTESDPILMC
jgi:hypothetical protein